MRVLLFTTFFLFFSCSKEKCYNCYQEKRVTTNKLVKGYPQFSSSEFVSCGDHIDVVDDGRPFILYDTTGDTIYTIRVDSRCIPK